MSWRPTKHLVICTEKQRSPSWRNSVNTGSYIWKPSIVYSKVIFGIRKTMSPLETDCLFFGVKESFETQLSPSPLGRT